MAGAIHERQRGRREALIVFAVAGLTGLAAVIGADRFLNSGTGLELPVGGDGNTGSDGGGAAAVATATRRVTMVETPTRVPVTQVLRRTQVPVLTATKAPEYGQESEDQIQARLDDWVKGRTVVDDEDRFKMGPDEEPYRFGLLGDVPLDPATATDAVYNGVLLASVVIEGQVVGFLGMEDMRKRRYHVPFFMGTMAEDKIDCILAILKSDKLQDGNISSWELADGQRLLSRLNTLRGQVVQVFNNLSYFGMEDDILNLIEEGQLDPGKVQMVRDQFPLAHDLASFVHRATSETSYAQLAARPTNLNTTVHRLRLDKLTYATQVNVMPG